MISLVNLGMSGKRVAFRENEFCGGHFELEVLAGHMCGDVRSCLQLRRDAEKT